VKKKFEAEVGKVVNDPDLEVSGESEKNTRRVQKWICRLKKPLGNKHSQPGSQKYTGGIHVTNRSGKNG
jgi:hypothetical protein